MLSYISKCLNKSKFKCYIDIEGSQTSAGGTLPPNLAVTTLKPDIVIFDKASKTVDIFELTIPAEHRIKKAHELKYEKYQHFISDIKNQTVKVLPFEIGSHTGYITQENKKTLHSLHKYCEKNITMKKFTQNISAIVVLSSYYIFNARNQENWDTLDQISAPFPNN